MIPVDIQPNIQIPASVNTPMDANRIANSMVMTNTRTTSHSFYDGRGHYINMDADGSSKLHAHEGYYKAMWFAQHGDIRLGEDGRQLYDRVWSIDGPTENWKPFDSIAEEYGIPRAYQQRGWDDTIRYVCQQKKLTVKRGIRIGDRAWWTTSDIYKDTVHAQNVGDKYAFQMYIDPKNVEAEQVAQAVEWMRWLTADQHSFENLQAMWATPFLEPYKHLGYILYGKGGNGKGILLERGLLGQYPDKAHIVKASALASGSKFENGQEVTRLAGAWWSIDPESAEISEPMFESLKSVCTGSTLVGRNIGQNTITVNNKSTLIIATNMPVSTPQTSAFDRRLAIIRMKDGRKPDDFRQLIQFIDEYGVTPFIIASCQFWQHAVNDREDWTDPWTDVATGDALDLDDMERYIVDHILADDRVSVSDIRHEFHITRIPRHTKDKLGLGDYASNGKRWLKVANPTRFKPYADTVEAETELEEPETFESNDDYTPLELLLKKTADAETPEGYRLVPAGQKPDMPKAAINWKRNYEDGVTPEYDALVKAAVPDETHMVIDMDTPKTDGAEHGWDVFNREAGPLPDTYMVRTPHDGIHAYYRIPDRWVGRVKSASHQNGVNVDVKAEAKGYVIAGGSVTNDGRYVPVSAHEVAEATPRMMRWLESHGYVDGAEHSEMRIVRRSEPDGGGEPDMSPVPEGQRNDTLYRWAFGRCHNHPEERERIRMELFDRGHASGLMDSELETIWRSIISNA